MSRLHHKNKPPSNSYWLKLTFFFLLIFAIIIYFVLSALLNRLPKVGDSINLLTPTPSSGFYEPPLASYVIAKEALLHPLIDPESEIIAQLVKDTPVLLIEYKEEWVKVQVKTTDSISGWGLRIAFAMNGPKPAPAVTNSTPTRSPTSTPSVITTLQMTPSLTAAQTVMLPIPSTPTVVQTSQITATLSHISSTPPTLIPPLELSPTPPILADAIVQVSTLKLRIGPDERYDEIGEVQQNTVLKVIGKIQDCLWLFVVTADGTTQGWVPIEAITLNVNCNQILIAPFSSTPDAPPGQLVQPQPQRADAPPIGPAIGTSSSDQSSSFDTSATQPEPKADLVASAFAFRNIADNTIRFDYTITNQGTIPVTVTTNSQPIGIAIHVFLSDSQGRELSKGQTIYPPAIKGLAPGQSFSDSYPGTFPNAFRFNPTGTLHLTLVVDAENVVNEVDETNNQLTSPALPITPTPQSTNTSAPTVTLTPMPLTTNTALPTSTSTYIPAVTPTLLIVDTPKWTTTATNIPLPTNTSMLTPTPTFTTEIISTPTSTLTNVPTITPTSTLTSIPTITPTSMTLPTVTKIPISLPTLIPSIAPVLLNPDFECETGYYTQTNPIGEEILIPNDWLVTFLNGAPKISSTRIFFAKSCTGNAHVEHINLEDSIVIRSQDLETPPEPGKPFDVAFSQSISATLGVAYSLSGWFLSLCGGSAVPSDCPEGTYMAKMLGIDPTGGTDANAASVIWTENRRNFWEGERVGWQQISVSALAQAPNITVFARVKSPLRWHGNHAFIDALSLVRAPVMKLSVPEIVTDPIITVQWDGIQSADVMAIPENTHQLLFDVQYRQQTAVDWIDIQNGFMGAGSTIINVPCTGTNYEFRIRVRAEQPDAPADAGAWPNHRYIGIWDAPVLVKVLGDQPSCQLVEPRGVERDR